MRKRYSGTLTAKAQFAHVEKARKLRPTFYYAVPAIVTYEAITLARYLK